MTKEQLLQNLTEDSFNGVITIPDFKQRVQDYAKMYHTEQCAINDVGWQSELLPDYDVKEINEIVTECKGNKDDLDTLITRIWNKGYITGMGYDAEND